MRASTIPIAITLTLAPLSALTFDQDEFCAAVTDIAQRINCWANSRACASATGASTYGREDIGFASNGNVTDEVWAEYIKN